MKDLPAVHGACLAKALVQHKLPLPLMLLSCRLSVAMPGRLVLDAGNDISLTVNVSLLEAACT